jgi:hypothetical protein
MAVVKIKVIELVRVVWVPPPGKVQMYEPADGMTGTVYVTDSPWQTGLGPEGTSGVPGVRFMISGSVMVPSER